jgi:hypothetical protein
MARNNNRNRGYARGARIATPAHGVVTVQAIRRHHLVVRDRAGRTWDLRRAGSRWTVTAIRAGV